VAPLRGRQGLEIRAVAERVLFLGGAHTESPQCTACGHVNEKWPEMLDAWWHAPNADAWACPECGARRQPWELDWQHTPHRNKHLGPRLRRGHPSDELPDALRDLGCGAWSYFYDRV
jgi:hypothetical protein